MEPIVNRLEKNFGDQLLVIRVDIQSDAGKVLDELYNIEYTPTFIYFDSSGNKMWRRVGNLPQEKVRESLTNQN